MSKNSTKPVRTALKRIVGISLLLGLAVPAFAHGGDGKAPFKASAGTGVQTRVTLGPEMQKEIGLKVARVEERPLTDGLAATGRIEAVPGKTSAVNAPVAGRILRLAVSPGQAVRRGQSLAALDSPEIRQLAVEQQLTRSAARADLARAEARLRLAKTTYERERELVELKISARKDFQVAEAELQQAQAEVGAVRSRLELSGAALKARLGQLGQGGARAGADGTVAITSPLTGVVATQRVGAGEAVEPVEALFEVVDTSQVWAVAQVYEKDLGRVRPGQPVEIVAEAYPGRTFRGRVASIGPVVDPETRTVAVRALLDNPSGLLKPQMFASLRLATGERTSLVLVAPRTAVLEADGIRTVYVQNGKDTFVPVTVQIGRTSGSFVEVTDGLRPGDTVVVERAFQLRAQTLKSQGTGPEKDEDGPAEGDEARTTGNRSNDIARAAEGSGELPGWVLPVGAIGLSVVAFGAGVLVARSGNAARPGGSPAPTPQARH